MTARSRFVGALVAVLVACATAEVSAQEQLTPLSDMVLDSEALLMPRGSTYGRAINGLAFQSESLLTYNGYQYATWYHAGTDEDVYIARRNLTGNTWELLDTGVNLDNGDANAWDAHNVISIGISGDGRIHFAWDLHGHTLRYMNTAPGIATSPGSALWDSSIFNAERSALNSGGSPIGNVTYPQFITHPVTNNMVMNYRTGSSGDGNVWMATYDYDAQPVGLFDTPHIFIDGQTPIPYSDPWGLNSNERNAYINGMDIDANGRIHVTWTWRETATGGSNHDIMYAYSDDGGSTWNNNAGANVGAAMTMNSPGIIVVPMNRGNTLMNQQTQAVDPDGRVHIVMWHLKDGQPQIGNFTAAPAAYYHYFRDPTTHVWTKIELPTSRAVGSRPDMAYDANGNLYVAYVSPGPGDGQGVTQNYYTEGDLIIATASKAAAYQDWSIVHTDTRDFSGEPKIDQKRLLTGGVLSLVMQENDDLEIGRTGTPLHVFEFSPLAKNLVWDGDTSVFWDAGAGWDSDGNNTGDAAFVSGNRVTFDDGATSFAVGIANPVSPSSTTFKNTVGNNYTVTGSAIAGTGRLAITGGGTVTLANGNNSYSGNTEITSGKLAITGPATIGATAQIIVGTGGMLDVTGATAGSLTLNNQTLVIDGDVIGNIVATNNSTVRVNSLNSMDGNLTVQSGSLAMGAGRVTGNLVATGGMVRVGGMGLPTEASTVTTLTDDFTTNGLGEYTQTRILDNAVTQSNVSFSDNSDALVASYGGTISNQAEQVLLLRSDDSLAVGETMLVDVSMASTSAQMDFGLAVSEVVNPTAASAADTDTRNTFDWASVSVRPSGNEIRVNHSINGVVTTNVNQITGVSETTVSKLLIERTSSTSFIVGYIDNSTVRHDATTINFTDPSVGTAVGFYGHLQVVGQSLGSFDNLRTESILTMPIGETLHVDGDYLQGAGASLELDIHNPNAHDVLDVTGSLAAGGILNVVLDAGAPALAAGAQFDLLDFGSLTGVFDSVVLPILGAGLVWDNSLLLSSGMLSVAAGQTGDYTGDGQVDAADYVAWRNSVGQVGAGLLADGDRDLHVDNADYSLWKANFGAVLAAASAGLPSAQVPEPMASFMMIIGFAQLLAGPRHRADRRA